MDSLAGTTLKGYELGERIGAGGFGAVYRGFQSTVGREVAIKVILPGYANQPDFIRRFESEAQIIARLEHPFIVPLYDYWRDPSGAYLVMRYLRGGSLKNMLDQGALDLETAVGILDQVAAALSIAHRNNVIHRDIKPANILLDEDYNAYLSDFGIAKDLDLQEGSTQTGRLVGSPDYLSPEQARSEPVTPQTDIYSLGVVLYEMLVGEHPFPDLSPVERLYKHLQDELPRITSLPSVTAEDINQVIQTATSKNPKHRFEHVAAMAAAFREAAGLSVSRVEISPVELLTPREQEVLKLVVDGLSNREIADELTIELSTVKWYIRQIYQKLNVRSRVQAIVKARELDLIVDSFIDVGGTPAISTTGLTEPENPYKGLRAFTAADEQDFFGRERLTKKLLTKLSENGNQQRFLAVVGPSGSGKSSLVKAGLVPTLWRGELDGSDNWYIVEMVPGARPLDELEVALMRIASDQNLGISEQLSRDGAGLLRSAGLLLPDDGSELLVVVDQFEEVFTLVEDEKKRTHFLDLLCTAVTDPRSRVRVVITLRADFYDQPLHYPSFGQLIQQHGVTVLPLSAEELARAIQLPAERVGVLFEEGLIPAIIEDVHYQPGALPLLQYALTELFEHRDGHLLTHEAYQEIGRAVGALAKRAEEVYQEMDENARTIIRQMFLRLVTLGEGVEDTRRRVPRAELLALTSKPDEMDEVIDTYAAYRLLSLDHDPATRRSTVEVAHEALLREWERLREWLNESRADIRLQRQLSASAKEWQAADHDPSFLLRGSRLEMFEGWFESTELALTQAEQGFMQACLAHRKAEEAAEAERKAREAALEKRTQRVLQILVGVFLAAALISGGLAIWALNQREKARAAEQDAREQQGIAERESDVNHSLALAANAQRVYASGLTDLATALALEATSIDEPPSEAIRVLAEIGQSPATRHLLTGHAEDESVISLAVSPDSKLAVSGGSNGNLILWDVVNGEEVHRLVGHARPVWNVAFSPDGSVIASTAGTFNQPEDVILWEVATGDIIRRLQTDEFMGSLAFSPDGRYLLTGPGGDWFVGEWLQKGTHLESVPLDIIQWEVESGREVRRFAIESAGVTSLAFTPDGEAFVSGSYDDVGIRLWDFETGKEIRRFEGHNPTAGITPGVYAIVSPDGNTILSTAPDYSLRLWDIESGEELRNWLFGAETSGLALSLDGRTASFIAGDSFVLWDMESWEVGSRFRDHGSSHVISTVISPDGRLMLTGSQDGNLRVWDLEPRAEIACFGDGTPLFAVAFSPDERQVLTGDIFGTAILRDVATGEEVNRFEGNFGVILEVAFSPDGKYVAVAAGDYFGEATSGSLILWDVETGERVHEFVGHEHLLRSLAFSPDGRTLLAGSQTALMETSTDGDLILWDIETGNEIRRFDTTEDITAIVFTADGSRAVTSSAYSQNITTWDVSTGQSLKRIQGQTDFILGVDLSPDEQTALSANGDNTLTLWDLESGEEIRRFIGHEAAVWSVDISPDGLTALSSGEDGLVILWDLATGEELRRFKGHAASVWVPTVSFSPNGQTAFSVGFDGVAIHWQIAQRPLEELREWVLANRYIRDFTCEERETYRIQPLCPP